MEKIDGREYGEQLADELDVEGRYRPIDIGYTFNDSRANRKTLRKVVERCLNEHLPDGETLEQVEIRGRDWNVPVARVWCKSTGFSYENSRVVSDSVYVDGHKKRFSVDIRPF